MDSAKQQLIDKLMTANNVLVTVSRNPSVDQLAACLGLTLVLNKQGKHAAAVFSGQVPSTLEFLKPEETLEKNTDSLRDFIIALDRAKADKLRYKVEDNVVRIFITPYKTSISQEDLEFSEGDFNVDLVVALGVHQQEDMDEAITAHGRILHDATVTSINTTPDGGLGAINWYDPQASSLSELVTYLAQALGDTLMDNQIATALLTGIVSETNRFSNDKTSSQTMSASAALMAAGANQQLVASKLEEPELPAIPVAAAGQNGSPDEVGDDDGTLKIDHRNNDELPKQDSVPLEPADDTKPAWPKPDDLNLPPLALPPEPAPTAPTGNPATSMHQGPKLMTEPPTMGGRLTANSTEEALDPTSDPFSLPQAEMPQLLDHKNDTSADVPQFGSLPPDAPSMPPAAPPEPVFTPPPASWTPSPASSPASAPPAPPEPAPANNDDRTLIELEAAVDSPHIKAESVDEARNEVEQALNNAPESAPEPIEALGAQQLGVDLHPSNGTGNVSASTDSPQVTDPTAPPPVPPPIPFQFGNPSPPQT
ncbi:MAG TPA: hypothetical protein VII55_00115 [Candidatus Saccharimonadales bacterium]